MAETNSEGVNIAAVEETTQGANPPPTSGWYNLEADAIGDPGPSYKKMARSPFTVTRQLRRPFISGLDAALTLDLDATKDHIDIFGEAMFKSEWQHSGGSGQSKFIVSAVVDGGGGADSFTVAADGDLAESTLVVTRGFAEDANNGVFVLTSGSTGTSVKVATGTLTAEADPPDNATLDVAGFQFTTGDAQIDADGNFITGGGGKDLTTLGLSLHQFIHIGSAEEVDPPHCFDTEANNGLAEVIGIAAHKLTLRRRSGTWTADAGTGKTIRVFFTKWIRNVARGDDDEKLVSHALEVAYPGLAAGPADAYVKLRGYMLDQVTFNMPAEGKVTMQLAFVGMTASDPTTTRDTGPSTALNAVTTLAVSTAADFLRLSVDNVDESGLLTDFNDMKIMLKNNIVGEKAVGHLGNRFTPLGVFEAQLEAQVYFTDEEIVTAVHDNRILRVAAGMRNDDFGMVIDIPSTGAMESPQKIEHNKLVQVSSKIAGFMDPLSGFTAGMSVFAFLPRQAPGLET